MTDKAMDAAWERARVASIEDNAACAALRRLRKARFGPLVRSGSGGTGSSYATDQPEETENARRLRALRRKVRK